MKNKLFETTGKNLNHSWTRWSFRGHISNHMSDTHFIF